MRGVQERDSSLAPWVVLAGVPFAGLCLSVVAGVPVQGDLFAYFQPMWEVLRRASEAGTFPSWDPSVQCGTPYFANLQTQLLWPPTWLHAVFPPALALALWLALHQGIAAFGAALLFRSRGLGAWASAFGALLFAFSGPSLSLLTKADKLPAWCLVPWLLLGLSLAMNGLYRRALFCVVASQLGMLLSGGVEIWIVAVGLCLLSLLLGPWAGVPLGDSWLSARRAQRVLALLATSALSLGLAAVQVWPFLKVLAVSSRAGGMSYDAAAEMSLQFAQILDFFSPLRFLEPAAGGTFLRTMTPGGLGAAAVGLGAISLFLASGSLFGQLRRPSWHLLGLSTVVVFVLLGLGSATPMHRVFFEILPPIQMVRYPEKFLLGLWPVLCLLAALGMENAPEVSPGRRMQLAIFFCLVCGATSFLGAPISSALFGAAGAVAFLLLSGRTAYRPILVCLAALELLVIGQLLQPPADPASLGGELAEALPGAPGPSGDWGPRIYGVDLHAERRAPVTPGRGTQRLVELSERMFPNTAALAGLRYTDGTRALRLGRQNIYANYLPQQSLDGQLRLLLRTGTSHLFFTGGGRLEAWQRLLKVPGTPHAPPLTWLSLPPRSSISFHPDARLVPSDPDAFRAMGAEEGLPEPGLVLISGDEGVGQALSMMDAIASAEGGVGVSASGAGQFVAAEPGVDADWFHGRHVAWVPAQTGWVLLREAWAPGWLAQVDGHREPAGAPQDLAAVDVPVVRGNHFMTAAAIPAGAPGIPETGELRVRFSYRPAGLEEGLIISLLSLLFWLALLRRLGARQA